MPDTENSTDSLLDVVIVGGGLAGLAAAYRLRDRNILLLEKEEIPGGRTESRTLGPYVYNAGAQVVLGDDGPLAKLVDEIGVKRTLIAKSKLPIYINGKLVASSSEIGLLWKMPIPLMDKIKFAWHTWKTRRRYRSLLGADFDPNDPKVVELNSQTVEEFIGNAPKSVREIWGLFRRHGQHHGRRRRDPLPRPYGHPLLHGRRVLCGGGHPPGRNHPAQAAGRDGGLGGRGCGSGGARRPGTGHLRPRRRKVHGGSAALRNGDPRAHNPGRSPGPPRLEA